MTSLRSPSVWAITPLSERVSRGRAVMVTSLYYAMCNIVMQGDLLRGDLGQPFGIAQVIGLAA